MQNKLDVATHWILSSDEELKARGGTGSTAVKPASVAGWLADLSQVIESRRGSDPSRSYVARLLAGGNDAILKKLGEEATEVVMASKDGVKQRVVAEMADLWFHALVLLAHHELRPDDVVAELMRREGVSGIDEKASRRQA
ncbi:MAG: phosphoribosyl-ATP diphosphatase [Lautropia sp.]|nr:phosphoribosyl-ATP diphosphatase [Lautropia sp.]